MPVRKLRAVLTAILLGTAAAGAAALVMAAPAQALTVSAKVGPLLKEAQALAAAKNYKGAHGQAERGRSRARPTPDDTTSSTR